LEGHAIWKIMSDDPKQKTQPTKRQSDRQGRLASALRANLRKRKAQTRARRKVEEPVEDGSPDRDR
jgi:hypothetical protein